MNTHIEFFTFIFIFLFFDQCMMIIFYVNCVVMVVFFYAFYYMFFDSFLIKFFFIIWIFVFAMNMFLISGDLVTTYIFWECIGSASFFLISFFWYRLYALKAGFKAFFIGKIGDCALLIAVAVYMNCLIDSNINYTYITFFFDVDVIKLLMFSILLCAFSKSTQFGLHIWLPDAMEGPIPVSALIHAATLVICGIVLSGRFALILHLWIHYFYIIYLQCIIIPVLVICTLLCNYDIKRYIAFSTITQISIATFILLITDIQLSNAYFIYHMFYKSTLFIVIGVWVHYFYSCQDYRLFSNSNALGTFFLKIILIFTVISSCSLWFSAGFYIKEYILLFVTNTRDVFCSVEGTYIMLYAVLITLIYSYTVLVNILYSVNNFYINVDNYNHIDYDISLVFCLYNLLNTYLLSFYIVDVFYTSLTQFFTIDTFLISNTWYIDLNIILLFFFFLLSFSNSTYISFIYTNDVCFLFYRILYVFYFQNIITLGSFLYNIILLNTLLTLYINNFQNFFTFFLRYNYLLFILFLIV